MKKTFLLSQFYDIIEIILTKYKIPGMKVLQQRIPNKMDSDEIHPDLWDENVVAYTGTHDSPTIRQWFNESKEQVKYFNKYKTNLINEDQARNNCIFECSRILFC